MDDNRRLSRWCINRRVKIKLQGAHSFAECFVKDLNLRGLQVILPLKLPSDTFRKFSLVLSDDIVLDVEAWVAWHKPMEGMNVYGLYFTKIKDVDKENIYRFLRRDFAEQIDHKWWGMDRKGVELEMEENASDKRVFARFPANFPARFLDPVSGEEVKAQVRDVSAKGIGLTSKVELTPYTSLELWLDIPDNSEPLYTRGSVTWKQLSDGKSFRAGIALEKADLMGLARALRAK